MKVNPKCVNVQTNDEEEDEDDEAEDDDDDDLMAFLLTVTR